jgi:hypothetical protein
MMSQRLQLLTWKKLLHLEQTERAQNDAQKATKKLLPQNRREKVENAGEEKWGYKRNEYKVLYKLNLQKTCSVTETKGLNCCQKANEGGGKCC